MEEEEMVVVMIIVSEPYNFHSIFGEIYARVGA